MIPLFLFVCIMVLVKEGSLFSVLVCHLKINIYMCCWKKTIFKTVLEPLFLLGFGQSEWDWVRSASFYFSAVLFALVVGWAGRGDVGV